MRAGGAGAVAKGAHAAPAVAGHGKADRVVVAMAIAAMDEAVVLGMLVTDAVVDGNIAANVERGIVSWGRGA